MSQVHQSIWRRIAAAATMLLGAVALESAALAATDADEPARYIGAKACAECHDTENKLFGHTQHANAFRLNPRNDVEAKVCEACHGPGSKHAANSKDKTQIIGFSREWGTPIEKQNSQCLNCHSGGQRMHWSGSVHQTNKLACSDCHNPMARFSANGLMKKASITETCQSCHQQQRAEFRKKSHMPVPEGKMTCEDCHNPHGSTKRPLLKADSVNDLCYTCHAEKRGPFLWEHAPVRENCMNCHAPHGSNQDKLLVQTRPMLCQQCHSAQGNMGHQLFAAASDNQTLVMGANGATTPLAPAVANATAGSRRTISRSCQNCHSQIHGSNSPSGARFQR
jgi:DmsE family decaheme c-type cytochrome